MKTISRKNALILLVIGIFVIAFSQIFPRYVALPDLARGLLVGVGIGFLLLAVLLSKLKPMVR